ncbi:protein DEHYDRATION-INDUCED 19 homolog 5-like isoform X2 [Gastrolobium bilobum]|uniref:protein DEHYDRATION-INDUCED 19 homolog 5-like isoform X2 n=1 Tax=Gastrolobium bilobum TaxID=150636 RepID=UPI002AAFE813|nr:protein DEHYDRATION-INDUCED 19 homolog 5-like isoform X2 [Gastrolobium bilobum]
MDFDFDFRSSIHSAKHLSAVQATTLHSDNYSAIHYTDVDNDGRSNFRCPFCDFEIEVSVLCSNLEEEHCSALKNVCPVCEENLGKDAIPQFIHSNSRKCAWKSEKSSIWYGNSAMLGKKLAATGNKQESMPDPLLSPFICNMPFQNRNDIHLGEDYSSSKKDINITDAKRSGTDEPDMGDEQDQQERRLRAAFVQELVLSTVFEETYS